jgi:DNA-binding CsgD family transcriptional regulator
MERLRQSELQSFSAFLRECYAFGDPAPFENFLSHLVSSLARLIPSDHVTYNEMYPDKAVSLNFTHSEALSSAAAGASWQEHMHEHPVLLQVMRTGDRHAAKISDFWSRAQFHDRGLHCDFYKNYDIEDALCITISSRLPRIIGVGWHDRRIFSERERLIADLARPHISQAWHNARIMSRVDRQMKVLRDGIENLSEGMILLSARGQVQLINTQARRQMAKYFGHTRQVDHSLPSDLVFWLRRQNRELNKKDDISAVREPMVSRKNGSRLVVRLLSQPGRSLILMEEQQVGMADGGLVPNGLTVREAEVLRWIAQGKTNKEIATILGMQPGTVKKHVEHLFEKLGVENRTAAATMVAAGQ